MAFVSLVFETDASDAGALGDALLEAGALSVTAEDALAGTADEQPVFDEPGERGAWLRLRLDVLCREDINPAALLQDACAVAGVLLPQQVVELPVSDEDWVRKTQCQFEPIRISERLWIVPSWCPPSDPGAINLALDPGIAFGTGSHATTRLCLRWLEAEVHGGETVLDYGCGSGILAIAALKFGAARAIGVDIDPGAVAAAQANAAQNDVRCEFLDTTAPLSVTADLVVANILANPLRLLAPLLASHARAGGRLALSGLLVPQHCEMADIFSPWFEMGEPIADDGWLCLPGVRR